MKSEKTDIIEYFDSIRNSVMIQLCLGNETMELTKRILTNVEEQKICQHRKPLTVVANVIYMAAINKDEWRTQAEIKKAFGVSALTLYKEIAEILDIEVIIPYGKCEH